MFPTSHDASKTGTYAKRKAVLCLFVKLCCKVNIVSYYYFKYQYWYPLVLARCFEISVLDHTVDSQKILTEFYYGLCLAE